MNKVDAILKELDGKEERGMYFGASSHPYSDLDCYRYCDIREALEKILIDKKICPRCKGHGTLRDSKLNTKRGKDE